MEAARPQGRIVVQGLNHSPVPVDMLQPLLKEQTILFSQCYSVLDGRHDYEIAIELLGSGTVPLKEIVTHSFPLARIQEALRTAETRGPAQSRYRWCPRRGILESSVRGGPEGLLRGGESGGQAIGAV